MADAVISILQTHHLAVAQWGVAMLDHETLFSLCNDGNDKRLTGYYIKFTVTDYT